MPYIVFSYLFVFGIFVSRKEKDLFEWVCLLFAPIIFPIALGMKFYTWNEK